MALLNDGPAGPMPLAPRPGGPEQRSRYDFSEPPKKRRRWLIPLLVLVALVGAVMIYQAGQRSASSSSTPSRAYMPNVVGMTAQQAANQMAVYGIRSVNVTGGSTNANQPVIAQVPPAGTPLTSSTFVNLTTTQAQWSYTPPPSTTQPPRYSATTTAPAQPAPSGGTVTAGTYLVGSDIEPGSYRTTGPSYGGSCYWARLRDTTGDFSSIIANGNAEGPATVTVRTSDGAIELSGSCIWTRR